MKVLAALLTLTFSTQAFAISNEEVAKACLEKGKAKIAAQAANWNCQVDLEKVEVQSVDNRWFNPSKYVWYQVLGECNGYDRVIKMVQYYRGTCL